MSNLSGEVSKCGVCGRNMREHRAAEREQVVNHKFNAAGRLELLSAPSDTGAATPPPPAGPNFQPMGDPVLRFVLIEAGVITVEQLDAVEAKLRATGVLVANPQNNRGT